LLRVAESAPSERPWNPPSKDSTLTVFVFACRLSRHSDQSAAVGEAPPRRRRARATKAAFRAFSTASAPVVQVNTRVMPAGAMCISVFSMRSTYSGEGATPSAGR
jgi:hypothetical protein